MRDALLYILIVIIIIQTLTISVGVTVTSGMRDEIYVLDEMLDTALKRANQYYDAYTDLLEAQE